MTKLDDRMTPEEFREALRETRVSCKVCGHKDHSLTRHLMDAHQMTPGKYEQLYPRNKYPDAKLWSPIVRELLKNLQRSPQESADYEEYLPTFKGTDQITADLVKMTASIPRHPLEEGLNLPVVDGKFYFDRDNSVALAAALAAGMNAYLSGPTGCGKTELVHQLHGLVQKPIIRINMNGDATRASLVGEIGADPQKGTFFRPGALPLAMKAGASILIDEIDYAPPHILAVLNSVLEGSRTLYVEETNETIKAKDGFVVFATANTGGKGDQNGTYTGTEILNTAFLDRFSVKVSLDYLPREEEENMLKDRFPKEEAKFIEKLVKFANEVRDSFKKGNLSVTYSTRKLIESLRLKQMVGMDRALELTLLNWLEDDDIGVVKALKQRVNL